MPGYAYGGESPSQTRCHGTQKSFCAGGSRRETASLTCVHMLYASNMCACAPYLRIFKLCRRVFLSNKKSSPKRLPTHCMQAISVDRQEQGSKSGLCCTPELRIHLETQLASPRPATAPRPKGRDATVTVMPRTSLVLRDGAVDSLQYDCTVLQHCSF